MNRITDDIKRLVPIRQLLGLYGIHPNRAGFIPCPFHQGDHTASLKIYDDSNTFFCFGCRIGGSVIDFAAQFEGLPIMDACKRLDGYFRLGLYKPLSFKDKREMDRQKAEADARRWQEEAAAQYGREQYATLHRYYRWLTSQRPTGAMAFDIDLIERKLDRYLGCAQEITFDASALVNALLSKHDNRGDYDRNQFEY